MDLISPFLSRKMRSCLFLFYFVCMSACLPICTCIRHMYGAPEGQRRAWDLLEVELVTVGSCYMGVEN